MPATVRTLAADPVVRAAAAALVLGAVPFVVPILLPAAMPGYSALLDMLLLLGVLFAFQYGLRNLPDIRARRFWNLFTVAISCWVVARAAQWIPVQGPAMRHAFDLGQDVLYVFFYFFVFLALEFAPARADRGGLAPALAHLRSAGAAVFAFGLFVYFVIIPTAVNPDAYATWVPSLLLYVTLDVYMVVRLEGLRARADGPPWSVTCALLLVTAVLWLVSDTMEALSYLGVLPRDSGTPLDLAWFPAYLTAVAAARARQFGPATVLPDPAVSAPERPTATPWGSSLLVYAFAVPAAHLVSYGLGLLDPVSRSAREICVLVVMLLLVGLAVAYQHRLARESLRLAAEHDAVARRLHALERVEAVGRLTGGVAHDFNNLFTIILTNAGLIDAELRAGATAIQDDLAEIVVAARRGTTLVKKLLGVGRRDLLMFRPVDLGSVVAACIPALRQAISPGIQIRFSAQPGVWPVRADAGSVEQILMNLVANANDAMSQGGVLALEVGAVRVDSPPALPPSPGASYAPVTPGEYGVLRVSDTGIGMDDPTREQVFEPFFTTKPPGQGSGLGMAMVYGLVKQHGGFVEVTSAPGRGAVVQVLLPAWSDKLDAAAEAGTAVPQAPPQAPTILVVDDEAPIRRAAQRSLERLGYRVLTAADGEEGLRLFEPHAAEVALVVSDLVMPKLGGIKLRESVHRLRPDTPFMFTSGYAAGDVPAEFGLDPGVPFLTKPWTIGELTAKVSEILGAAPPSGHG